jgi:hypothetical protein
MSKNIEKHKKGRTQKKRSVHKRGLSNSKNRKHKATKRRGAAKIKNPPIRPLESSKTTARPSLSIIPEGEQVVATTRQPKRSSAAIMRERAMRAAAERELRQRELRQREIREREARERAQEEADRQRGWFQYFYDMVGFSSNNSGSKRIKKKKKCNK